MNGVLGHDSAFVRLYWAGDNLSIFDKKIYRYIQTIIIYPDNHFIQTITLSTQSLYPDYHYIQYEFRLLGNGHVECVMQ